MARLNERFLRHHGPTDVITFDYAAALPEPVVRTSCLHLPRFMAPGQVRQEEVALPEPVVRASSLHAQSSGSLGLAAEAKDTSPGPGAARVLHGDVFICLDEARRQAREWGTTWPAELVRYVVHGLLHLSGYDDLAPGPRRRLKRVEHRLVRRLAAGFPFNRLGRVGNVRS
jgi:rRNA maturation RNase YbeY